MYVHCSSTYPIKDDLFEIFPRRLFSHHLCLCWHTPHKIDSWCHAMSVVNISLQPPYMSLRLVAFSYFWLWQELFNFMLQCATILTPQCHISRSTLLSNFTHATPKLDWVWVGLVWQVGSSMKLGAEQNLPCSCILESKILEATSLWASACCSNTWNWLDQHILELGCRGQFMG